MKKKSFDAIKLKRQLQKKSGQKLSRLTEKEQLNLLHKKFECLVKKKVKV